MKKNLLIREQQAAISIVMPVYNAKAYLEETLNSLQKQTLKNFEVICVDDGSTDGSLIILEDYSRLDNRIRVFRQQHISAAAARNYGITKIKGEYVIFLDADDVFLPDMLQKLYAQLKKTGADICLFSMNSFDAKTGDFHGRMDNMLRCEYCPKEVFSWRDNREKFFQCCDHYTSNKIYRSEFLISTGLEFENVLVHEDTFFSICNLAAAKKITYVDECLLNYRVNNPDSLLAKERRHPEVLMEVTERVRDWLKEKALYENLRESFEEWVYIFGYCQLIRHKKVIAEDKFQEICEKFNDFVSELGVSQEYAKDDGSVFKISVIIYSYNMDKYACQCVDSILNQTFSEVEIIIIDDASTDGSYDKLMLAYGNDIRVKLFHNYKHIGAGETRNLGLKLAQGKYVYFVDCVDMLLPGCLEYLYHVADRYNADIVHMSEYYQPMDEEDNLSADLPVKIKRDRCVGFLHRLPLRSRARLEQYIAGMYDEEPGTNLYKRCFLLEKELRYFSGIYDGLAFAGLTYVATDRIWCIPGPVYLCRPTESFMAHVKKEDRISDLIKSLVVSLRMAQDMPGKSLESLDEKLIMHVYMKIFRTFFNELHTYYDGNLSIPMSLYTAVDKVVRHYFPTDAFLVGMLFHYASSTFQQSRENLQRPSKESSAFPPSTTSS